MHVCVCVQRRGGGGADLRPERLRQEPQRRQPRHEVPAGRVSVPLPRPRGARVRAQLPPVLPAAVARGQAVAGRRSAQQGVHVRRRGPAVVHHQAQPLARARRLR